MFAAPLLTLVRRLIPCSDTVPDAELLDRFARGRDQAAFELLVLRHGPLVWGTCRRMLAPDRAAAEDACQAAFVALARHAGRLRARQALAAWLHRVAVRACLDLLSARRPSRPLDGLGFDPPDPEPGPAQAVADREFRRLLDDGLNRLPDKLRAPFVLCELEGRTNAEAAAVLGCPVGTVGSRLSRARQRLREWLTARGAAPAVGVAVALAAVPPAVRAAMIRAGLPGAAVGPAVWALADRAVRVTLVTKLRLLAAAVAVAGVAAVGLGLAAPGPKAADPPLPPTPALAARTSAPEPTRAPRADAEGLPLPDGAVARLGSARLRHGGCVTDICFSPDGKRIVSVGADNTVRAWDGDTGQPLFVIRRQEGEFDRVAFADGGKVVVAVGRDREGACDVWRIGPTGEVTDRLRTEAVHVSESAVRFNADGSRLAVGVADPGKVFVIDTATGRALWTAPLGGGTPHGVAFGADNAVAVSDGGATVRMFDSKGNAAGVLTRQHAGLGQLALSPDGKWVAANDRMVGLVVWDRASGKFAWSNKTRAEDALVFSPDGRSLAHAGYYTASTLSPADGKDRTPFTGMGATSACAFRPDGKVVAFGTVGGTVCLYDPVTGKPVAPSPDLPHEVRWMRFSADGRTLYGWSSDWFAWDVATAKQRRVTNTGWNYGVALSPDGLRTASTLFWDGNVPTSSSEKRFQVCDAATGKLLHSHPNGLPPGRHVYWQEFSPDGKALVGGVSDETVRGWTIDTAGELFRLPGHRSPAQFHAFSADGRILVTGAYASDGREEVPLRVFDLKAGKELWNVNPGAWVLSVAVSADGRRVAVGTAAPSDQPERAIVWDVAGRRELARVTQHGPGQHVALSPDGRMLAVATRHGGPLRVWEVASASERFVFRQEGDMTGLLFAPDGRTLAAASKAAPVYLWDVTGDLAGKAPPWDADAADRVWDDLTSADAVRAMAALRRLRADPAATIPFLRERVRTAPPDPATLRKAFADLDAADFRTREQATQTLAGFDEDVREALQAELARGPSVEVRRRVQGLLDRLKGPTPGRLRRIRAVEAAEGMGSPEAQALLEAWAGGPAGSTLTTEAKAALSRRPR
jgi:RNA polymerase sigma factor (sigma-70 family)